MNGFRCVNRVSFVLVFVLALVSSQLSSDAPTTLKFESTAPVVSASLTPVLTVTVLPSADPSPSSSIFSFQPTETQSLSLLSSPSSAAASASPTVTPALITVTPTLLTVTPVPSSTTFFPAPSPSASVSPPPSSSSPLPSSPSGLTSPPTTSTRLSSSTIPTSFSSSTIPSVPSNISTTPSPTFTSPSSGSTIVSTLPSSTAPPSEMPTHGLLILNNTIQLNSTFNFTSSIDAIISQIKMWSNVKDPSRISNVSASLRSSNGISRRSVPPSDNGNNITVRFTILPGDSPNVTTAVLNLKNQTTFANLSLQPDPRIPPMLPVLYRLFWTDTGACVGSSPCLNGGTCNVSDTGNSFCQCTSGHQGSTCDQNSVDSKSSSSSSSSSSGSNLLGLIAIPAFFLLLVIVLLIVYFVVRRRQRDRERAEKLHQEMSSFDRLSSVSGKTSAANKNGAYNTINTTARYNAVNIDSETNETEADSGFSTIGKYDTGDGTLGLY